MTANKDDVSFWSDENVQILDCDDVCTPLWLY